MELSIVVIQFFLSLSILVILHEFGHFLPARIFKVKVEKFYLFFDPFFSLFKVKKGDTEYGVGWLPLGGYVKLSGMVDESFDTEALKQPVQDHEFRAKKAWQRLIIMLGGVIVNFILGFFLFAMIFWAYGEEYIPAENVTSGIYADSLGRELGLQTGDKIIRVGEAPFEEFNPGFLVRAIALNNAKSIEVERDGSRQTITVEDRFVDELTRHSNKNNALFSMRVPFMVATVTPDGPAGQAGMLPGDKVVGIDSVSMSFIDEITPFLKSNPSSSFQFHIVRDGQPMDLTVVTKEDGLIGVGLTNPIEIFGSARREYTLAQAFPAGVNKGVTFLSDQIKAFGQMFKGKIKASESLGGFATIGGLFPKTFNWERFWTVTAILSLILGFMNLLPIPALDGGHVMFLIWEVVTGRKVSDKVMEVATTIGFVLILGLVIYANGLDIMRIFGK